LVVNKEKEFLKRVFRKKNITRSQADPLAFGFDALLQKI